MHGLSLPRKISSSSSAVTTTTTKAPHRELLPWVNPPLRRRPLDRPRLHETQTGFLDGWPLGLARRLR